MKNSKLIFKQSLLAGLLTLTSAHGAWGATAGDVLPMDAADVEIARARQSSLTGLKKKIFGKEAKAEAAATAQESESVQKLNTLMAKREFATWFRFSNEVTRNLNTSAGNLHAMVKPVITPQEGFMAKLMMVRQAKYTIDLTYYIFDIDEAGRALVNELMHAVRRGVNVRVMVDSLGSMSATLHGNPHFKTLLEDAEAHAGFVTDPATGLKTTIRAKVEVLTFNPISNLPAGFRSGVVTLMNSIGKATSSDKTKFTPLDTTHWNPDRRSHDKIILADAQFPELSVAMIGGRNIANHYYELDPKDHENFRDAEVIIRNDPALARTMDRNKSIGEVLNQQYDRLYFHRANREVTQGLLGFFFQQDKQLAKLDAATARVTEVTQDTMKSLGEDINSPDFGKKYLATGFMDENVNFINSTHNLLRNINQMSKAVKDSVVVEDYEKIIRDASTEVNQQSLLSKVVALAGGEKEAITVISPYLWLSAKDIQFIQDWLSVDVKRTFTVYTNSIVTSDNMPAQVIVDMQTAPALMANAKFRPQIKVYEYGRADDVNLGGTKYYGKLHLKGAYFKASKTSIITTYNKDPRSEILNSEVGLSIEGPAYAQNMQREIADLFEHSHEWGSDEFRAIRSNPKLPKVKQAVIKYQSQIFNLMQKLHFWWLI